MSITDAVSRGESLPPDEIGAMLPRPPACSTPRLEAAEGSEDRSPERRLLCPPCSELDFDEIFRVADAYFATYQVNGWIQVSKMRTESSSDGLFVQDLGYRPTQPGSCPLCSFFGVVRGPDTRGPFELRAFSSVTCSSFLSIRVDPSNALCASQNAFLAVVPSKPVDFFRSAMPSSWHPMYRALPGDPTPKPPGIWARELGLSVDFSMVKGWFSFCKEHHCETCNLRKYQAPESLPGFRLIDCDSSSLDVVEQQPTVEYAALSYVWGENIEEAGPWPTVISDAVLVTRQLGLRYLWVDRLCIDQEDAQTKHFLISNMDVVYRSAEITIIAAAGSTADHGLPGVGTAKRKPQPKIQIGATVLASPLENCREDIYRSTWWTRGWTYQEGVLARRRLVFTESQVYWECESMVTWEAIHLPLESLHAKHKFQMDECMNASVFSGKRGGPFQEYRTLSMGEENDESLYKAAMHIHNFTGKNLTFPTDSLLAMQGILKHCCVSNPCLAFLHGMPLVLKSSNSVEPGTARLISLAAALTSWGHTPINNSSRAVRLQHLPSWTWAGWKGQVEWDAGGASYHDVIPDILSMYPWSGVGWATDIRLRPREGELYQTQSIADASEDALLEPDFDGVLYLPQPYVMSYRDLLVETEHFPWVASASGTSQQLDMYLYLSDCETADVPGSPTDKTIKGDLRLVLVAISWDEKRGTKAGFLAIRPTTPSEARASLDHIEYCERIGAAWVNLPLLRLYWVVSKSLVVAEELRLQRMTKDIALC